MKKALCILLIVFLSGCASTPKRYFANNEFISKGDPKLKLKINDDFKYIGYQEIVDRNNQTNSETKESHVFIYTSQGKVKKILTVEFSNLVCKGCEYLNDLFYNIPKSRKMVSGALILANNQYQYCAGVLPSKKDRIMDFIIEKGYLVPECVLIKESGRVCSEKNDMKIEFFYSEELTDSGYPCDKWYNNALLTDEQKLYMDGFVKRSAEAFRIIK